MNSVTNKTRLAEKHKTKKNQQNYKTKKEYELNNETKQNERKQKRENMVEDIDLGRFFELATSIKIYVNSSNLHEIKNEILQDYTGDFVSNGLMIIGPVEHKTNIRF